MCNLSNGADNNSQYKSSVWLVLKSICSMNLRTSYLGQKTLQKKSPVKLHMNFPAAYEYLKYVEKDSSNSLMTAQRPTLLTRTQSRSHRWWSISALRHALDLLKHSYTKRKE
jgi:hypothetical protein